MSTLARPTETRFLRNIYGALEPFLMRGKFQAGSTQAIAAGEILELSSGNWIPLDADQAMAGIIAIAAEDVLAGDRAGYYQIIVPRPGDVFSYALASGSALTVGASLYWSSSTVVKTSGSNVLGNAVGQTNYPQQQQHLSAGNTADNGTTIRSTNYAEMTFKAAASYWAALQT